MKRIGVILAGCGSQDGSEIHEATLTLYFLDKFGAKIQCFAPKIPQWHTVDHYSGKVQEGEHRQILTEAARIARGDIKDLSQVDISSMDGLIFPGGFGVAKNLCDFAFQKENCQVNKDVEKIILSMHKSGKPQGFICIAPVLAARVLGKFHPEITIGDDPATAKILETWGAKHIISRVDEIVYDPQHKIVSTAAYMIGPTISKIALGIEKLVKKVMEA
ncbi:MAG TPA: isoprenoid biosynthesis glyoxalase ElbB [Atribacterota bacterium]|nr:isoprenoid biosynthesis glyoxalase ElbB [Atribacterota bacterium]